MIKMIKIRNSSVRNFQPPKIILLATDYIEMIHWNTSTLSLPPLLQEVTDQDILLKIQSGGTAAEWSFDQYPCHTQAVE